MDKQIGDLQGQELQAAALREYDVPAAAISNQIVTQQFSLAPT